MEKFPNKIQKLAITLCRKQYALYFPYIVNWNGDGTELEWKWDSPFAKFCLAFFSINNLLLISACVYNGLGFYLLKDQQHEPGQRNTLGVAVQCFIALISLCVICISCLLIKHQSFIPGFSQLLELNNDLNGTKN